MMAGLLTDSLPETFPTQGASVVLSNLQEVCNWSFTAAGLSGILTRFPFNLLSEYVDSKNQFGCKYTPLNNRKKSIKLFYRLALSGQWRDNFSAKSACLASNLLNFTPQTRMKMRTIRNWCLFMLLAWALAGCREKAAGVDDFTRSLYVPEYASGFGIKGAEGKESVLLTVANPWQGADSVTMQLLVVRGGEPVPDGFDGQVLEGEAKRIVAMSSTHIALLDAVGESGRVVGVSGMDYIFNPGVRSRKDSIGDVGYEGNINYELLLSLAPDIVLIYGVNGASPMTGKLAELGIPYMYVGDYLEESPLGKAEWMVALAELAGRREAGEKAFAAVSARYEQIKKRVADRHAEAPSVMLNAPYGDAWFMPSVESYVARLIADAGGDYVYKKNTGNASASIGMEEAYLLASEADLWLNVGTAATLDELKKLCPKFTDVRSFRNGGVYNNNLRVNAAGGNDYYESAVVNPDLVLRDLVKIFHPELVEEDFVYYKQLK